MHAPDLRQVRNFTTLIRYLEDELGWPLDGYEMDDLTFDYEPSDLGLKEEEAAKVKSIKQLRPLTSSQPWGIFFIEFDKKQLPVVVLRRILSHLVLKKRASANAADAKRWNAQDLLFVSAFGPEDADGREIGFAHFHEESGDLPSLRVLGWDGDNTALTLQRVASTLKERLRWTEKGETVDAWRQRWSGAFKHRPGHIIKTSDLLAEALAALAKRIRDAARTLIEHETEHGPLRKLHRAFQTNLIHDLDEDGFSDTYAQTITYGLLTAAINRTDMSGGRHGTFVKADDVALAIKPTSPFLKEMLETFLKVGGRKGHMDFDELGVQDVVELLRSDVTDIPAILADFGNKTRGEDPVIHFYEHFLSAYNKKLKVQRGVFYTPQAVVGYIVRSVHELLQTEFGLEDGLASTITWGEMIQKNPSLQLPLKVDGNPAQGPISENEPFVQILDPATGTATFLVETIDVIHHTLKAKWQAQRLSAAQQRDAWNEYVPNHLLPRLHGYELMMAPYAIAHMKIGLKLTELGYNFASGTRAQIYLTNALEPWQQQLPLIGFDALAHEAAAVNEIKRHKRFTVVIGNPPYQGFSANTGTHATGLVEAYRFCDDKPIGERNPSWLLDDYVKFLSLGQTTLKASTCGALGMITNNGYIDNPTFRGMRDSLLNDFRSVRILNLNGDSKKKLESPDGTPDANVFDIQQGVAIGILVRGGPTEVRSIAYTELWGSQNFKLEYLKSTQASTTSWKPVVCRLPFLLFRPTDADLDAEFRDFTSLNDLFLEKGWGFKTRKDYLLVDFEQAVLCDRFTEIARLTATEARRKFSIEESAYWDFDAAHRLLPEEPTSSIRPVLFRPFDVRSVFYEKYMIERGDHKYELMSQMFRPNIALITVRRNESNRFFDHVFCTRLPAVLHSVSAKEANFFFPFFRYDLEAGQKLDGQQEFFASSDAEANCKLRIAAAVDLANFHYIYAILHSGSYRTRYAEQLRIDFPRLPLTGNLELFRALARLGGELTALHLLEFSVSQAFQPVQGAGEAGSKACITLQPITEFIGTSKEVTKVGYSTTPSGSTPAAPKAIPPQAPAASVACPRPSGTSTSGATRSARNGSKTAEAAPSPTKTSPTTTRSSSPSPKPSASWRRLTKLLLNTAAGRGHF
jgi:hypothetical protein